MVEVGDRSSGRSWTEGSGGFDEKAAIVRLDRPGNVARILRPMIELADDPAASANQDLWGIGRGLGGEQIRHLCEASAGVPQIDPSADISTGSEAERSLDAVTPARAVSVRFRRLSLIMMHRDRRMYEWVVLGTIALHS